MLAKVKALPLTDLDCHALYGDIHKKACRSIERCNWFKCTFMVLFVALAFYVFWWIVTFLEHSLKCILSSVMMRWIEGAFLLCILVLNFKVPSHEPLSEGGLLSTLTRVYNNYQCSQLSDPEEKFAEALEQVDQKLPHLLSSCEVSWCYCHWFLLVNRTCFSCVKETFPLNKV